MVKMKWDIVGKRLFETGTAKGALFVQDNKGKTEVGVPWSGLVSVKQSPDGAEETPIYADNIKYLSLTSQENFKGTIEALTYPDEYQACDGSKEIIPGAYASQQGRAQFNMAYQTIIGNDTQGMDLGTKLHLIWNAKAAPTERGYETVNETPNALTFSWSFTTTPAQVEAEGFKPMAHLVVDSTKVKPEVWTELTETIYGNDDAESSMPSPDEVIEMLTASAEV